MNTQDLEQQAREILAAEYERDGKAGSAKHIRTQPLLPNKARAVRAIVAALRQQTAAVVDEKLADTQRAIIEAAERRGYERAKSEAPVVDDARMARALEWVRVMAMQDADGSHVPAIEEAIAAYDPNCGARTVRVVDDAMREDAERYRWLRDNAGAWEVSRDLGEWMKCDTGEKYRPCVYFSAYGTGYGGMFLDDAIDAARAQGVQP